MVPLAGEDGAGDNDDVVRIVTALTLYINLCMLDVYSPFLSILHPLLDRSPARRKPNASLLTFRCQNRFNKI